MSERYRRELDRLLGIGELHGSRAWRTCFRPSFSVECLVEVVDGGPLRIVSPRRQIHAWLQQHGESPSSAWVWPAVADERVEISKAEADVLADRFAALALGPLTPRGLTIDGMPVTLVYLPGSAAGEVYGEISLPTEDWRTFARALFDFARDRARWEAIRVALEGVSRCLPAAQERESVPQH